MSLKSSQLWNSLEKLFGSQLRALKIQFQITKKDSLSIASYFCKLKEIGDGLTLVGQYISNYDFILQLLAGLPLEYDVVVGLVNSSHIPMEPEKVESLLLSQESQIQQAILDVVPLANLADKSILKPENNNNSCTFSFVNNRGSSNNCGQGRRG